jgi:hypothetical protein
MKILSLIWEPVETWVIYALGGGWGHLHRALALGRLVAKHYRIKIITNSPYASLLRVESAIAHCELYEISPHAGFATTCESVRNILLNTCYHCLIVDTFPRGLGGELVDILPQLNNIPRVLIHRDINPQYVVAKDLRSFVANNFDLAIVPGEGNTVPLSDLPQVRHTEAWLIRNANELPKLNQARLLLRLKPTDYPKTIVVCAAGQGKELTWYGKLTTALVESLNNVTVRCLAAKCPDRLPDLWVFHYPGIECLLAADVVVGGGGYNTLYECAALKVPLVAVAQNRRYDRQAVRIGKSIAAQNVASIEDAVSAVRHQLSYGTSSYSPPNYINGAVRAADLIERAIA